MGLVVQNNIQQRFMHLDVTIVRDKAELTKFIHKVANSRSCGSDHFGKRFLTDLGDYWYRLSILTVICKEE